MSKTEERKLKPGDIIEVMSLHLGEPGAKWIILEVERTPGLADIVKFLDENGEIDEIRFSSAENLIREVPIFEDGSLIDWHPYPFGKLVS